MKKIWILAALAGAYYLYKNSQQTPAQQAAATGQTLASQVQSAVNTGANLVSQVASAASGTNGMGFGNLPSELRGIDGMAPAGLGECMAGLGAYGELGGSFYGSY